MYTTVVLQWTGRIVTLQRSDCAGYVKKKGGPQLPPARDHASSQRRIGKCTSTESPANMGTKNVQDVMNHFFHILRRLLACLTYNASPPLCSSMHACMRSCYFVASPHPALLCSHQSVLLHFCCWTSLASLQTRVCTPVRRNSVFSHVLKAHTPTACLHLETVVGLSS